MLSYNLYYLTLLNIIMGYSILLTQIFLEPKEGHYYFCWGQSGRIMKEVTFVLVLKEGLSLLIRVVMMF